VSVDFFLYVCVCVCSFVSVGYGFGFDFGLVLVFAFACCVFRNCGLAVCLPIYSVFCCTIASYTKSD
jgi:hypothetical protein